MQTGTNNGYEWLEADPELRAFLRLCPGAIAGKYLAITAVDSGSFVPSESDVAEGWKNVGGIAYSPRLASAPDLPKRCCCLDCYGFDEWYIFETPPTLGNLSRANFFVTAIAPEYVFPFINASLRLYPSNEITDLSGSKLNGCSPSRILLMERIA